MLPPSKNLLPEVSDKFRPQQSPLTGKGLTHIQEDTQLAGTTWQLQGLKPRFWTVSNASASVKLEEHRRQTHSPVSLPKDLRRHQGKS